VNDPEEYASRGYRRATRRQTLRFVAAATVVPALGLGFPRLTMAAEGGRFSPPTAPMLLSRQIVRELPNGAQIVIKRVWKVSFAPTATGVSVIGQQVSIDVKAPPTLEFLAQLEEQRQETNLFPLTLSAAGMIASNSNLAVIDMANVELVQRAIAGAEERIESIELNGDAEGLGQKFLSSLQGSGAELASKVPSDLFHPQQSDWQNEREIDLPQGLTGTVLVIFEAKMNAAGECMERVERRVISSVGESMRSSSEIWELTSE
jgi:hypothetical protein